MAPISPVFPVYPVLLLLLDGVRPPPRAAPRNVLRRGSRPYPALIPGCEEVGLVEAGRARLSWRATCSQDNWLYYVLDTNHRRIALIYAPVSSGPPSPTASSSPWTCSSPAALTPLSCPPPRSPSPPRPPWTWLRSPYQLVD